jgi:hypothetical protein
MHHFSSVLNTGVGCRATVGAPASAAAATVSLSLPHSFPLSSDGERRRYDLEGGLYFWSCRLFREGDLGLLLCLYFGRLPLFLRQ